MALEIERKYLVHKDKWLSLPKTAGELYRQGYLLTAPEKTLRVRLTDHKAFLTIKGANTGATRQEFEYEIPQEDAKQLLDNFAVTELSKRRYKISFAGKVWEVDEFHGNNSGLIVAEIELEHETEPYEIPEWIDVEVTGDAKYYNSNLTQKPFNTW